jgi:hypothetical protein
MWCAPLSTSCTNQDVLLLPPAILTMGVSAISCKAPALIKSICAGVVSHLAVRTGHFLCCFLWPNLVLGNPLAQTGDMTLDELRAMLEEAARPARAAAAADGLAGVAVLAAAATDAALGMQVGHWACAWDGTYRHPASFADMLVHSP